ncbi:MAG: SAM-dependent methyltransferase [Opitutus sp.]|nr:SAM-dependent methyltransferase [Opitutus sp.]MCS6247592.1 SAM-dependent methyltransferase [Opitutus sp.]MCS6274042.1 SAM-dependent methyltransferase [Opitutus sp.]MCS6276499.1 SAM-dependent methyltransferase [Opitutus sp.]MCS6301853.1 SAM-dependent methyltransferase [Opitutus sp.]
MPLEIAQAITASRLTELRALLAPLLQTQLPLTLEIGSGHGHYLTAYAEAHPQKFCIGIDIIGDRLERSARKSTRAALTNIAWVHAEVTLFLEALPADTRLAEIFLLFSDPWPKRRHCKNRVLQTEFLTLLASRAGEGARFCFRTDHVEYFDYAQKIAVAHADWQVAEEVWPFELASVFQDRAENGHQSFIARRRAG